MIRNFPEPPAHLHLIGIKGMAMTAIAQILQGQGYLVTGSDVAETFPTDAALRRLGISFIDNFAADNLSSDVAAVIYSTAYGEHHIERQTATTLGIPQWSYPEVVQIFFELFAKSISVAGSHGKTTTTAILGHLLAAGGLDPTVIVGGVDAEWGSNARLGGSAWFVLETDEFQNKFEYYAPLYLLITNVDYDHPDFFKSRASYNQAFLNFVKKLPASGTLVVWGEEPLKSALAEASGAPTVTYGLGEHNDWRLENVRVADTGTSFNLLKHGQPFGDFNIPFPGEHYALNATGAIALADLVGVSLATSQRVVKHYRGTARRLEIKGNFHGAVVIDDYGHHPTEVATTLAALRARYSGCRLIIVFQPHTFSRTLAFLDEFVAALDQADLVYLLPIYGSAREHQGGVQSEDLARLVNARSPQKVIAVASFADISKNLHEVVGRNDVVVTMGAGDVWKVAEDLVS